MIKMSLQLLESDNAFWNLIDLLLEITPKTVDIPLFGKIEARGYLYSYIIENGGKVKECLKQNRKQLIENLMKL